MPNIQHLKVNHQFFDNIVTESQAYWLGFLFADGAVIDTDPTRIPAITLGLQIRDITHLYSFRTAIGAEQSITHYRQACKLQIRSHQLVHSLARLNVWPRKSLVAVPPHLREELQHHFWRGVFEGDGSISAPPHQAVMDLTGSQATCFAFSTWLASKGIVTQCPAHKGRVWCVATSSLIRVQAECNLLYNNATVFLQRKKERADYYRTLLFKQLTDKQRARNTYVRTWRLRRNPTLRPRGEKSQLA